MKLLLAERLSRQADITAKQRSRPRDSNLEIGEGLLSSAEIR